MQVMKKCAFMGQGSASTKCNFRALWLPTFYPPLHLAKSGLELALTRLIWSLYSLCHNCDHVGAVLCTYEGHEACTWTLVLLDLPG